MVPAQAFRSCLEETRAYLGNGIPVINCSKGIERGTHLCISQIAEQVDPKLRFAVLSGPSHAEEVAKGLPTTLIAASRDMGTASYVQDLFMSDSMRV